MELMTRHSFFYHVRQIIPGIPEYQFDSGVCCLYTPDVFHKRRKNMAPFVRA